MTAALASVAAGLVLAAVALTILWTVLGVEQDITEVDAEVAARTTSGPARVFPADDLTRLSAAVTDARGRAL